MNMRSCLLWTLIALAFDIGIGYVVLHLLGVIR